MKNVEFGAETGEAIANARRPELDLAAIEADIWLFDHRTDLTDELLAPTGEEAPRKYMRRSSIKALFKKGKEVRWQGA